MHNTYQQRVAIYRLADRVRIDTAMAIHGQNREAATEAAEKLARLQRGRMLDGTRDHVCARAPVSPRGLCRSEDDALQRVVTRLGAAARKNDLVGVGAEELCDLPPRLLHGFMCRSAERMAARRVAELFAQVREHCLRHSGIDR